MVVFDGKHRRGDRRAHRTRAARGLRHRHRPALRQLARRRAHAVRPDDTRTDPRPSVGAAATSAGGSGTADGSLIAIHGGRPHRGGLRRRQRRPDRRADHDRGRRAEPRQAVARWPMAGGGRTAQRERRDPARDTARRASHADLGSRSGALGERRVPRRGPQPDPRGVGRPHGNTRPYRATCPGLSADVDRYLGLTSSGRVGGIEQAGRAGGPVRGGWRRREAEVRPGRRRGHAAAGRAHQQALLDEERLVDVLDRLGLLADADGERRQPDRAAAELAAQGGRGWPGRPCRGRARRPRTAASPSRAVSQVDRAVAPHLGEVAHPAQQPVGDAGGAPGAAGDLPRARRRRSATPRMPAARATMASRSSAS